MPETGRLPIGALFAAAERFADPPADWDHRFPVDHGVHPDQFGEYWLFAGRLDDDPGITGFQLVFYRLALTPDPLPTDSAWVPRQIYRAQLVLDGPQSGGPHSGGPHSGEAVAEERYSRDALGLSGADRQSVWLEDWAMNFEPDCGCFILRAATGDLAIELTVNPGGKEPIPITGVPGPEFGEPGSHGYWWPGLRIHGRMGDDPVAGEAVLEHVWGRRLPVAQGQLTLNRLWLELTDGTALRCVQLRRRGGGGTPLGGCLAVSPEGELHQPGRRDHELTTTGFSPNGYPLDWSLNWPALDLTLAFEPQRRQPPHAFMLPIWSGLLQGGGDRNGQSVQGWGWLELSGY